MLVVRGIAGVHLSGSIPSEQRSESLVDERRIGHARADTPGTAQQLAVDRRAQAYAVHATIVALMWHEQLLSLCINVVMSVNISVRLDDRLAERLRLRARAAGESLSDRLRRYAEEGARRDEHPLITFRDGPTGRRAGVVGGPDVWEIAMWIDDLGPIEDPAAELVADEIVSRPLIEAALAYRADYPEEIQARIDLHRIETAAADAR